MFWADRLAGEIERRFEQDLSEGKPIIIRDEKTLSGRVHIGSMRGIAIHGAISEALTARGIKNTYYFEFNDFDPMDGIPTYLDQEKYQKYLGMPLRDIPSPEPGFKNFAEYYGAELKEVIEGSGFHPTIYRGSELYLAGKMDGVIREALEGASEVRRIYKEVSGGSREESWLPLSVVCPQCGKLSTTRATNFDGETVEVECRDLEWVKGCHFKGRISPFGGKAKLPWKVEWAAKWKVVGVMVEGAGKDHSTKGGSRDVARHISEEVFKYDAPLDAPYEFFLVGGQKMASSKGRGSSAKEVYDLLPPKIFRLALLGKEINQAFNFEPEGDTIPVLYDQYDKLADGYKKEKHDDYAKLFEYIHVPSGQASAKKSSSFFISLFWGSRGHFLSRNMPPVGAYFPRFSQIAFVVQMPHLDMYKEFPGADAKELNERATYAKRWLDTYAPEKFVFKLQDLLPEEAKNLSSTQKRALTMLGAYIESASGMPSGEELHKKLHALKEEAAIAPAELFSAIYLSFLGKSFGPKAGWFLSVLDKNFVLKRIKEVTT